jgi:hypothetical protein
MLEPVGSHDTDPFEHPGTLEARLKTALELIDLIFNDINPWEATQALDQIAVKAREMHNHLVDGMEILEYG